LNLYQFAPNADAWVDPWGWAGNCGGKGENIVRVRHYTNRRGLEGIRNDRVIKAKDNNRVYVESANSKPLSVVEAEKKFQLKKGRGRDYVETDVSASKVEVVPNPRYGTPELTVKGDLPLSDNAAFVKRK
jgi:hypothetical protein